MAVVDFLLIYDSSLLPIKTASGEEKKACMKVEEAGGYLIININLSGTNIHFL